MRRPLDVPAHYASEILRRFDDLWSGADHLSREQQLLLWESRGYRDWVIDLIDDFQRNLPLDEDAQHFAGRARQQAKAGHARHALLTLRIAMQTR